MVPYVRQHWLLDSRFNQLPNLATSRDDVANLYFWIRVSNVSGADGACHIGDPSLPEENVAFKAVTSPLLDRRYIERSAVRHFGRNVQGYR